MTAGGREFQVAGAAQLKDRLPISVRLNSTSRNGTADDRSDRVPLRALMCRLRYAGADICRIKPLYAGLWVKTEDLNDHARNLLDAVVV